MTLAFFAGTCDITGGSSILSLALSNTHAPRLDFILDEARKRSIFVVLVLGDWWCESKRTVCRPSADGPQAQDHAGRRQPVRLLVAHGAAVGRLLLRSDVSGALQTQRAEPSVAHQQR